MTPAYSELVAIVRREGTAMLTAARLGLETPVPSCDGWTVGRLVAHVGRVYRYAAACLAERATSDPGKQPGLPEGADPIAWGEDALEELVDALASTEPDAPVWNWSVQENRASWWARRMAHESAVHRWDTQNAVGYPQRIEHDLAVDGVAELVEALLPRLVARTGELPEELHGHIRLETTENGHVWDLRVDGAGVRLDGAGVPDVTVQGSASALLLLLYGRVPARDLPVHGDESLLDAWAKCIRL